MNRATCINSCSTSLSSATACSSECEELEVKDIVSYDMYVSSDCVAVVTGLLGCDTV